MRAVIIVQGDTILPEIIAALDSPGRFPRLLDCGEQQGNQDRDDRDAHQQLHQCGFLSASATAHDDSFRKRFFSKRFANSLSRATDENGASSEYTVGEA